MKDYDFVVTNEYYTDATTEEELVTIFNEKLATLLLLYEKITIGGCNNARITL
jgi:hypothetical protein